MCCCSFKFVLTNKERLVGNMKVGGILGCSNHEIVEFKILHGKKKKKKKKVVCRIVTIHLRIANFHLFKDLLGGIP